ncbi:unnamed protein product, partial [Adineta steineri]
MGPNIIGISFSGLQIMLTAQNILSRLEILNVSFPFQEINSSLSLTTFCGGRNDLSTDFDPSSSQNSQSSNTSQSSSSSSSSTTEGEEVLDIDWNDLAASILHYNDSAICPQSYSTGSGNIQQTILVNRTCRCVIFDQVFNSYDLLKQFATLVRPLLYGKIYYHPSNIHYDNIIK